MFAAQKWPTVLAAVRTVPLDPLKTLMTVSETIATMNDP
jgi:hypothetical protein